MSNIKKNFAYSSILTTANYIFPLITFPYISRVLGVNNIGICNFVDSIINYYSLFAMMGIGTLGLREIAGNKNDKDKCSKVFSSLLVLNLITTILMIITLIASIYLIPRFYANRNLMLVGVVKLLFTALSIEWLYRGLEDFKYITERSIIVRFIFVLSVFLFVRKASDYSIYYILTVLMIVINGIINIIHSHKYIDFSLIGIKIKPYVKGFFVLGLYFLLTSMYTSFNVAYLGFILGDQEVGYFTTATKLSNIILAMFTAFTSVMLPRMTSLMADGRRSEFDTYFYKSISILFAFSIPIICFCTIFADQLILWIAGAGYESSIPCMQIIMPLVFVIGYEQILVIQILIPLKKDKSILVNSIVGALVGVISNILLVPHFKCIGSSIVWVFSEMSVLIIAQYVVSMQTKLNFPFKIFIRYILFSLPIVVFLICLHVWNPLGLFTITVAFIVTCLYFGFIEVYIQKNELIISLLKKIVKK